MVNGPCVESIDLCKIRIRLIRAVLLEVPLFKKMTSSGTPSRFLKSVLQNGVGRYVCQLKRISLVFSKEGQSSLGVRDFLEDGVVDYAKKNPGTVVYVSPQQCSKPKIVAEYLNGTVREEVVSSKTSLQISEVLTKLTNQSGLDIIRIRKPFHTDNPSIQGLWHPFTNRGAVRPPRQGDGKETLKVK